MESAHPRRPRGVLAGTVEYFWASLLQELKSPWELILNEPGVIIGPVKLFCFSFQMGVSKLLKIMQLSFQLKKQSGLH